jgi:Domain of unknown function (DUF4249)
MKKICFLFSFIGLLTFTSCDEDRFSPIVEIEIPAHKPRLVIRADWSAGSDSLTVFVSKSRGVLDKTKTNFSQTFVYFNGRDSIRRVQEYYDTVANAKVELLRNGQLLGTIPYLQKGYHQAKRLYKLDTISGVTYTIRVSAPNLETVEASQKTQKRFSVLRGSFKADGAVARDNFDPFGSPERGDELSFELQDNGDDENYYTLEYFNQGFGFSSGSAVQISRDTANKKYSALGYIRNIDPNMEDNALSDRTFNGKSYVWRFWLSPSLGFVSQTGTGQQSSYFNGKAKSGDRVTAQIRSLSKDYVLFVKTLSLSYDAQDNPFFTEPVLLHSNVKNGYGIFTIGSSQQVSFVIQ